MRTIKVKFVDRCIEKDFLDILSKKYNVEISEDPEYLFYSVFGTDHLKYDCIRIFWTCECYTPDFNECDYAIAFDRMSFGDRYLRLPLYRFNKYKKYYQELFKPRTFTISDIKKKSKFCNFVYSNCFAQGERVQFYEKLSQYKRIESGGCYMNNVGGPVLDKLAFQKETKFTIAFENASYDGYLTEKLLEGFAAGTVPIYFGDPRVTLDFNKDAFINVNDYNSFDEVVDKVREIDNNDELYLKMLNTPPLLEHHDDTDFMNFIYHIIDQDYKAARRRSNSLTVKGYNSFKLRYRWTEKYIFMNIQRIKNTIIRLKNGTFIHKKPQQL